MTGSHCAESRERRSYKPSTRPIRTPQSSETENLRSRCSSLEGWNERYQNEVADLKAKLQQLSSIEQASSLLNKNEFRRYAQSVVGAVAMKDYERAQKVLDHLIALTRENPVNDCLFERLQPLQAALPEADPSRLASLFSSLHEEFYS